VKVGCPNNFVNRQILLRGLELEQFHREAKKFEFEHNLCDRPEDARQPANLSYVLISWYRRSPISFVSSFDLHQIVPAVLLHQGQRQKEGGGKVTDCSNSR